MGMRVDIATLFPEMCQRVLDESILGRAARRGHIETHCHQIRDYTLNRQKQTDDYPYGGGCGMVLYAQPIADCIRDIRRQVAEQGRPAPHIVFMTAGGQRYTEAHARRLAQYDSLLLVCGHYEGIDERVIEAFADEEISIGDYILTGGELASLVVGSTPSTPAPRCGRAGRCRPSCSAATTRRWTTGGGSRAASAPGSAAPTCGKPTLRPAAGTAPPCPKNRPATAKRSPLRRPPPRRKPARKRRRNSRRRTEPRAQLVPTC